MNVYERHMCRLADLAEEYPEALSESERADLAAWLAEREAEEARRAEALADELAPEFVALYKSELTTAQIAERYGVHPSTVSRWAKALGLRRKARRRKGQNAAPPELRERALRMIAQGHAPQDVCAALGIGRTTLYEWRRAAAC